MTFTMLHPDFIAVLRDAALRMMSQMPAEEIVDTLARGGFSLTDEAIHALRTASPAETIQILSAAPYIDIVVNHIAR